MLMKMTYELAMDAARDAGNVCLKAWVTMVMVRPALFRLRPVEKAIDGEFPVSVRDCG
jgi:hypothetical protein